MPGEENLGAKNAILSTTQSWKRYMDALAKGNYEEAGKALEEMKGLMLQLEAYGGEL